MRSVVPPLCLVGQCLQALRREIELMDGRGMKQEGPRLVARCWTDQGFKQRLLQVRAHLVAVAELADW